MEDRRKELLLSSKLAAKIRLWKLAARSRGTWEGLLLLIIHPALFLHMVPSPEQVLVGWITRSFN